MGDKEQARLRKQRLQAAHDLAEGVSDESDGEGEALPKNRRELKELDKREVAIQKALKKEKDARKNEVKA